MGDPLDPDRPDMPFYGLFIGRVADRDDPKNLGRVRVRVPGLLEPASAWAFPLATLGGGSAERGGFFVPEKGATVGVFFHQGNVDQPFYMAAHWRKPTAGSEVPEDAQASPDVRVIETASYVVVIDDRPGSKKLVLRDKGAAGDSIEMDGTLGQITIKGTSLVRIEATGNVEIEGLSVLVNGVPAGSGQL